MMKCYHLEKLDIDAIYNTNTHRLVTDDGAIYEGEEISYMNDMNVSDKFLKTIHQLKIKFGAINLTNIKEKYENAKVQTGPVRQGETQICRLETMGSL